VPYIPVTDAQREDMLHRLGIISLEDLFADIPQEHRFPELALDAGRSEMEVLRELATLANSNAQADTYRWFLGAGAYDHFIPAVVPALASRGEFLTAYTPYQPEISQGTLQAIFEYQTLISRLTGMDASNASHYDGATATAEAGVLAYHQFRGKRTKFLVSCAVNPQYRETLRTYMAGICNICVTGDESDHDPLEDWKYLLSQIDTNTALVVVQYPDFFGRVYDYTELAEVVHENGAMLAIVANPMALGLLKAPGEFDADIVVGDGQPLGLPLSFGGPYLGFFATKNEYVRKLAGRLVGETVDHNGKRGYVLTLTAREQHIRREKATSNICSNQGLMALAATVYMSLLGKNGFKQVSELCYHKAHYAAEKISKVKGYSVCSGKDFFNEFVVSCPSDVEEINHHLLDHNILGGYNLSNDYKKLGHHMLIAVTEMNTKDEIDALCEILEEVNHD